MFGDYPTKSSELKELEQRIQRVEGRNLLLFALWGGLALFLLVAPWKKAPQIVNAAEAPAVLHVKGLVIEDDQGRSRILLGAPFPSVADRVRQDETTSAMVFLDQQGHDRFAVGEKLEPQINGTVPANYRSPGTGYGLTLFDPSGNERGEMGFLSNGSNTSRAVMVLDRPAGDAIGAIVDDSTGYAGLAALYPTLSDGAVRTGILLGTQGSKAFLSFEDLQNQPRTSLTVEPGKVAAFQIFDHNGRPGPNLLHSTDRALTDTK